MTEVCYVKKDIASRPLVQQIAERNQVPDEYLHKNEFPKAIDSPNLWKDTLLIDFSRLSSSSPITAQDELDKLRFALSSWGCFMVVNHGIEQQLLDDIIGVTKEFFQLPVEEKMKCATNDILQGYDTDAVCQGKLTTNWNDRLFLTVYPKTHVNLLFWPEQPQQFREVIHKFGEQIAATAEVIYKAMARSLNADEDCFVKQGQKGFALGRFTFYPKCPRSERVLGSRPHLDGSLTTIVLADEEGLHIQNDNMWYKVPVIPGALFFNCGDFAEVFSNGIFKSTLHRVVTNSTKDRTSVAAFFTLDANHEVGPLDPFVTKDRPAKYKKFTPIDYMMKMHENDVPGRNALDFMLL
ncbi:jasmonate-induced oxygenase 4-like [Silene latifolia]|uniref:jasmonate-induced oxygenase 4-like n=1 Tax=Silene latifolia TaxID=37657 RepID=UPI003D77F018